MPDTKTRIVSHLRDAVPSQRPDTSAMMRSALVYVVLLAFSVVVFLAFDRDSHSASDTIRPFVITVAPVWLVALVAMRRFRRPSA